MSKCGVNKAYINYLDSVSLPELKRRIDSFNKLNLSLLSEGEIIQNFLDVVTFDVKPIFNIFINTFPKDHPFFFWRVRVVPASGIELVEDWFRERKYKDDEEHTGRFDFTESSLLYVSMSQVAPMTEVDLENNVFVEIVYKMRKPLTVITLGDFNKTQLEKMREILTGEQWEKAKLLDDFETKLLLNPGTSKEERNEAHRVARAISKCMFSNCNGIDGIMYPSLRSISQYDLNVVLFDGKDSMSIYYAICHKNKKMSEKFGISFDDNSPVFDETKLAEIQTEVIKRKKEVDEWARQMGFDQIDIDDLS